VTFNEVTAHPAESGFLAYQHVDYTFQIFGEPVPEPKTSTLFGSGVLLIVLARGYFAGKRKNPMSRFAHCEILIAPRQKNRHDLIG
jgi:hypothetical protein